MRPRVIPVLLLKNGDLVKGVKFKKHEYIGDPINTVRIFNEKEVDEICILDISRTIEKKEPDYEVLKEVVSEAFMPLSYGGGIKNLNQVEKILNIGVEKVIFNTAAYRQPDIIRKTSEEFGSSTTVVSIDIRKSFFRGKEVYVLNGKYNTKKKLLDYAKEMESLGAGEIILTSIDNEGLMKGYDIELLELLENKLNIPVIINGGAGGIEDFDIAISKGASAVAAGSFFVFASNTRGVLITYPTQEILKKTFGAN